MSELTQSQKEFVNVLNSNVLLSASAGSGKTTTMVAKLTHLIADLRVPIKNILTLTFTRAAANEMRQKLYVALSKRLASAANDMFLIEQLENLNLADIGTIDSLCNKIVKKYFYVVGVDRAFELLGEEENDYILDKTIVEVCNSIQDNDAYFRLYQGFLAHRSPQPLYDVIKTIINFLLVMPNYDRYCQRVIDDCYSTNVDKNICAEFLVGYFHGICMPVLDAFEQLSIAVHSEHEAYKDYVSNRLGFFREVCDACKYAQICNIVSTYELYPMPHFKINEEVKAQVDSCKVMFDDVYKLLSNNCNLLGDKLFDCVKNDVKALFDIVALVLDKFKKYKDNVCKYSFADIEHFAYKILEDDVVQKELSEGYKYIFFDEYQDINELQDRILERLSRNNLNLIGDVKQSIYEFRQSTPELFVEKFSRYNNGDGKVVNLNQNFRSSNNILQFVNKIFSQLITKDTLGIEYKKVSMLAPGLDKQKLGYDRVELDIVNSDSDEREDGDIDYLDAEINLIIDKVYQYTKLGYDYSKIAVLLRDRGDLMERLASKFKEYNIPCGMDIRLDILCQPHIRVLYSVLKILSNYRDDISLCSVLLSPICGFDENDLAQISKFGSGDFYQKFIAYNVKGELADKINKAKGYYNQLQLLLTNNTPKDILKKVILDFDLYNYYLSMPDGVDLARHIDSFLSLIAPYDNVTKAVEYVSSIDGKAQRVNLVPNTQNYITISTIHSSKGLEYECVILASTGRNIRYENNGNLNISKKYGIGIKCFDMDTDIKYNTFVKNACVIDNNINRIKEEIRLLYVALTRAKEHLCIVGTASIGKLQSRHKMKISNSKNYLDLILKSFDKFEVGKLSTDNSFVVGGGGEAAVKVNVFDNFSVDSAMSSNVVLAEPDNTLSAKLSCLHNFVYPYSSSCNVAKKNSVTSVLHEEYDYVNTVESLTTLALDTPPNVDSLKLGTAYHAVMQCVNYHADNDVEAIISNLKKSNILSDELVELIDVSKIHNAINHVKKYVKPDSLILKEQQFTMRGKHKEFVEGGEDVNTIIQGVIDLAIVDADGITLIDFKTNKTNAVALANLYSKQLSLYAAALEKHEHIRVKNKVLYSFYLQKFVIVK